MRRDDILRTLREHMTEIRGHGVARLAVFGSVVRGDERPDSDIDILVEFEAPVSIFKFLDLKDYLETILGQPVDLVMRKALRPELRDRILTETVSAN